MTNPTAAAGRREIRVRGIVQGVGFRPFVYNLAQRLQLSGYVLNSSAGVLIEVEGDAARIDRFVASSSERGAAAGADRGCCDREPRRLPGTPVS